jgi:hypothetical protein
MAQKRPVRNKNGGIDYEPKNGLGPGWPGRNTINGKGLAGRRLARDYEEKIFLGAALVSALIP